MTLRFHHIVLAGVVTASLGGCGRENQSDLERNPADEGAIEGVLNWYTLWGSEETGALVRAFNERFPNVQVIALQFPSSELLQRVRAEYESGVNAVDVMNIVFGLFAQPLAEDGILARYRPSTLDGYPPDRVTQIFHEHWTVMGLTPHGICYNSDVTRNPPTSYEDLLDERFQGKIVAATPLQVSGARNFLVETHGYWGEERWQRFWRGLAERDVLFTQDAAQGMQLLTRGERSVYLYCNTSLFMGEIERGAPLQWVTAEPNVASEIVFAMAEHSDNPVAARAFYEFLMSEAGQTVIGESFGVQPVHPFASLPALIQDAANVRIVFSPSEFQIEQLGGRSPRDPGSLNFYESFASEVFGLR